VAGWTQRSSLALVAGVALWVAGCASRPAPQPRPAGPAPVPAAAGAAPAAAADPAAAPAAPATEVTGVEAPVEVLEPLAELPTEEVVDELANATVAPEDAEAGGAARLQESLATFEEATRLWDAGESDFALAALDRA